MQSIGSLWQASSARPVSVTRAEGPWLAPGRAGRAASRREQPAPSPRCRRGGRPATSTTRRRPVRVRSRQRPALHSTSPDHQWPDCWRFCWHRWYGLHNLLRRHHFHRRPPACHAGRRGFESHHPRHCCLPQGAALRRARLPGSRRLRATLRAVAAPALATGGIGRSRFAPIRIRTGSAQRLWRNLQHSQLATAGPSAANLGLNPQP